MAQTKQLTGKADFEKSINTLIGIIEGITLDGKVNDTEIQFLENWLNDHRIKRTVHPFSELLPVVEQAISDGVVSIDEVEDIKWLCHNLKSHDYYSSFTADMQRLHAVIGAIGSDGVITEKELRGLTKWLKEHKHLQKCWPYDEVMTLITAVMADKKIDAEEHKALMKLFGEFVSIFDNKTIVNPTVKEKSTIASLCTTNPVIKFESVFCLTGESERYSRTEFKRIIEELGGGIADSVSQGVDYLIVGGKGSKDWAFACYGRKVEAAAQLKKTGHPITIIHESEFHKAVASNKPKAMEVPWSKEPALNSVLKKKVQKGSDRKIGVWLGIGIFLLPVIFAWFTLRKGHSLISRIISFVWMILVLAAMSSD